MEKPVRLGLLSRSLGPTCSNVEYFYMQNKNRLYRAYGVPGGAILVQKLPVTKTELIKESVVTEVVIDGFHSSSTNRIDDIGLISYCNSQASILAGASYHDLCFHSLLLSPPSSTGLESPRKKEPSFRRLLSVPFPGIVAMSWTGDGEGLLLADARGQVSCVSISVESSLSRNSVPIEGGMIGQRSISQRHDQFCNMQILWIEKLNKPQNTLAAGYTTTAPFACGSKLASNEITIVQSGASVQKLNHFAPVLKFCWSPGGPEGTLSPKVCLLTVGANRVIRIWIQTPSGLSPSLGTAQLHTESPSVHQETRFCLGGVIELDKDAEIDTESVLATWLKPCLPNGKQDHQMHWIASTYSVKDAGTRRQVCAIYAIYGMPFEISQTQIRSDRIVAELYGKVILRDSGIPVKSLDAYLVQVTPSVELLLAESSFQESLNSVETHTSFILVHKENQTTPGSHGGISLDCKSMSEIIGFTSDVSQLVAHPKYDLVCVLTEERVLNILDLWPVRQLLKIKGIDLEIGSRISTLIWLDNEIRLKYGELGYLLIAGDSALVLCLVITDLVKGVGKPAVSLQKTAFLKFQNPVLIDSIIPLRKSQPLDTCQELKFLARERQLESGVESYHLIDVRLTEDRNCSLNFNGIGALGHSSPWTVLESVREGVVVGGTCEGTLEFYKIANSGQLEFCNSCILSTTTSMSSHSSVVSCISACHFTSYIACVTSFDTHQNEDKIHILQSESTSGSLDYRLEDSFVSPSGIITQLCWVQTPSPVFHLVIGYQAGQVDVYIRKRQGVWVIAGSYLSSLELTGLTTTRLGLPIVGAGRHMLFLSTESGAFTFHLTEDLSIMQTALRSGGPLSEYHPFSILILLHLGHLNSVGAVFNEVIDFLKAWEKTPMSERLEEVYPLTINGPSGELYQSLVELLAPDLDQIKLGNLIIQSTPFALTGDKETKPKTSVFLDPSPVEKKEDTGLLTGQFDMTAFGMGMDNSSFSSEEDTPEAEKIPEGNGHIQELEVPKEECVYFELDNDFTTKTKAVLFASKETHFELDNEYLKRAIRSFISKTPDQRSSVMPLDCLLQLSTSNVGILGDLMDLYLNWMDSGSLDIASMKFMTAVKLIPCAISCQPIKTNNVNHNEFEFRRESFVSPFLKLETDVHRASETSVASSSFRSSKIDERLTASYVSWPQTVGITPGIESVHILWAIESQDPYNLLTQCLEGGTIGLSWEKMKELGAGFWLKEKADVLRAAEEVAKEQFRRKNDPHDCALIYIALKKQALLSRLFRSNGYPKVADLLIKDFTQKHNQQIASKNAFVLLGQHRYSLAAAFFLVGGHKQDAIGVCVKEMQDPQLALFLATLLDDQDQQLRNDLILKELYPQALEADDRVAQGMLLWLKNQYFEALDAISTVKALKSELSIADRAISKILLFQFVLCFGFSKLTKRFVPLWLLHQIQNLTAHCAHVLETCGLPSLSLRALHTCQFLHHQIPESATESAFLNNWMTRLVTSMMIRHLPSPHAVNARDPAMILWHQHIQQDVDYLNQFGKISLNFETVLHQMQYIMDCLYELPCAPVFPQETSHPPELGGAHCRGIGPSTSSKRLLMEQAKKSTLEDSKEKTEDKKQGQLFVDPECCELLHVEGDRCIGVCFSRAIDTNKGIHYSTANQVAVATGKYGIHFLDWEPQLTHHHHHLIYHMPRLQSSPHWPNMDDWLESSTVLDGLGSPLSMKEVHPGGPLRSHPNSSLFLSGFNETSLLLWEFGMGSPRAQYSLPTTSKTGSLESIHRLVWNSSGDRFAGIGSGGTCACWRVESARYNTVGQADWCRLTSARRGHDVEFVEWSGSVIATTGEDDFGKGVVSLWDTLTPTTSCKIANLPFRNPVSELATIPGTLVFLTALESGSIQAHDFRMMSRTEPQILWSLNSIHDGPITSMEVGWAPALTNASNCELVVASGGKDGDICIANEIKDKGCLRQRLSKAHWKKSGQLAHLLMSSIKGSLGRVSIPEFGVHRLHQEASVGTMVLDLEWCDEGLLSAGADGYVELFPWSD
eukprot:g4615.t1